MNNDKRPVKINDLLTRYQIIEGDFNNLDKFNFEGVYIIYDGKTENVVYIGSAYARTIKERLQQYKRKSDTGNTLLHAICKKDRNVAKVKDITPNQKDEAIKKILSFKIKAIPHKDLEYRLIHDGNPLYNTAGCQIDYSED